MWAMALFPTQPLSVQQLPPTVLISHKPRASLVVQDYAPDFVHNYACAVLNDGMLMLEFRDAIYEGDGNCILRVCKFLLLQFRYAGRKKHMLPDPPIFVPSPKLYKRSMIEHHWLFWDTCQSQGFLRYLSISGDSYSAQVYWGTELVTPMCWSCTLTHSVFYTKTPLCHELTDWSIVERFASRCSSQGSTLQQCTDWHRLASCRFQQVVHTWWDLTHLLLILKSLYFSMSLKNTSTFYCIHDIKGGHNL